MPTAAAPTAATFLASYPEFAAAGDLIDVKLAEAALNTNTSVYGSDAAVTDVVMLQAAILLLESPRALKMRSEDAAAAMYRYELRLKKRQRAATMGMRVFGT